MTKIGIIPRPETRGAGMMPVIILLILLEFKVKLFETKQQIFYRFSYF